MVDFNKQLKILRTKRGISVKEMAEKLDIAESTYRDWEYGRMIRGTPYVKLSEIFGVSLNELFSINKASKNSMLDIMLQLERLFQLLKFEVQKSVRKE